jgi:hypothetical protein
VSRAATHVVSRVRIAWALAAAIGLLAAGCSHVDTLSYPDSPSTTATTTPTTLGNLAGVEMAAVNGTPKATVAIGPGGASLSGTVSGPTGPVGGADVHAERLVGDQVAAIDVISQPDGKWTIPRILGGRYRLRAWRAPDLALTVPQIFFLPEAGDRAVALHLDQFGAGDATTAVDPNPPVAGEQAGLAVQITGQTVDAHGVVRAEPVVGSIELAAGLSWTVLTPNPVATSNRGKATWQVMCGAAGPQPLAAIVNNTDVYPLDLPACVTPPEPTTTTTSTPPVLGGSTTTSTPSLGSTTTTRGR